MGAVAAGGGAGWAGGGAAGRGGGGLGRARASGGRRRGLGGRRLSGASGGRVGIGARDLDGFGGCAGGAFGGRPGVAGLAGGSLRGGVEKLAGGELFLGGGVAKDPAGGRAGKRKSPSGWHRRLSGQGGPASSCYNDITGSQGRRRSVAFQPAAPQVSTRFWPT